MYYIAKVELTRLSDLDLLSGNRSHFIMDSLLFELWSSLQAIGEDGQPKWIGMLDEWMANTLPYLSGYFNRELLRPLLMEVITNITLNIHKTNDTFYPVGVNLLSYGNGCGVLVITITKTPRIPSELSKLVYD